MTSPLSMKEVCLIDAGISNIGDLALTDEVETLNLHCNAIQSIGGIGHLNGLRHLDLSSNAIAQISGLEGLIHLRTLNLSCNLISKVTGLQNLQSLVHLNLSYNCVRSVRGLCDLWGSNHQLSSLELQGNELSSIEDLIQSLSGLGSLEELTLQKEGSSNPVCQLYGYRTALLNGLPQLKVLDGKDRRGQSRVKEASLNDIPGLEQYLDFLVSSDANTSTSQENPLQLITPKIDQLLDKFRKGALRSEGLPTSHSEIDSSGRDQCPQEMMVHRQPVSSSRAAEDHENRILDLEKRLQDMLERRNMAQVTVPLGDERHSSEGQTVGVHSQRGRQRKIPKRDTEPTDESEQSDNSEKKTPGKLRKSTKRGNIKKGRLQRKLSNSDPSSLRMAGSSKTGRRSRSKEKKDDTRTKSTVEQDSEKLTLLQELEQERVRRWKAEQAAMKLADRIKVLQTQATEGHEIQSVAVQATSKLKEVLMREKENRLKIEGDRDILRGQVDKLVRKLETAVESSEEKNKALTAMETTAKRMESDRLQQQAHTAKQLQEYQLKLGANSRELDLLRTQVKNSDVKIHQLQELLATREQEHRNELKQLYRLDSKELQDMLNQQRDRERETHQKELMMNQQRIDDLSRQYTDLEDEFRLALRLEADRYKQIFDAYESSQLKEVKLRDAAETATLKEKRASALVTELTAMVKEQKGRLAELSRSKQEVMNKSKDQIQNLDSQLEESKRKLLHLEAVSKEKIRLQTQLVAQESVIEGLKSERKLWGQELAQQGASLAQDRGRLESKIEALTAEVASLKKQQVAYNESLKIKTKVIDDQTDTIRKLKEGLKEKDDQIKKVREESLGIQRSLEDTINEEQTARQDLKEQVEHLEERKESLKAEVQELQLELDESQRSYRTLDRKWKDKGDLIGQLEEQVREVKKTFEEKEAKLRAERDKAIEQERGCKERMQKMDNAFRKQMETAQQGFDESYEHLRQQKDRELEGANQKVQQVEEEMRLVLTESANQKRAMEDKLRKVTKVFNDLQQDLG